MWKAKKTLQKEADITLKGILEILLPEITNTGQWLIEDVENDQYNQKYHCDGSEYDIHFKVTYSLLEKFGFKSDFRNKVYKRVGEPIQKELDIKLKTNDKLRDYRYEIEATESLDI